MKQCNAKIPKRKQKTECDGKKVEEDGMDEKGREYKGTEGNYRLKTVVAVRTGKWLLTTRKTSRE